MTQGVKSLGDACIAGVLAALGGSFSKLALDDNAVLMTMVVASPYLQPVSDISHAPWK